MAPEPRFAAQIRIETMIWLFGIQLASTLLLTGLIWTVQLIHYPLLAHVGGEAFPHYHASHCRRITWLVAPLMVIEALTALSIALWPPPFMGRLPAWLGLAILAVIWITTLTVQVPLHQRLATDPNPALIRRLVRSNWIRTGAWSLRSLLLLSVLPAPA